MTRREEKVRRILKERLALFKKFTWVYWDLVPDVSHKLRGDNIFRVRPSTLLEEVIFLVSAPYSLDGCWDTLVELKRAAWTPNVTRVWTVQGGKRQLSKAEFWTVFESRLEVALRFRHDLIESYP